MRGAGRLEAQLGVELLLSCSHHSISNPVERFHRDLRAQWQKAARSDRYDCGEWEGPLIEAVKAHNICPSSVTKISPFKVVYGTCPDICGDNRTHRTEIRKMIHTRIEKAKTRYAIDKKIVKTLKEGEIVKIRYEAKSVPFYGKVISDQGLAVLVERQQGKAKRSIRINKKHCFVQCGTVESPLWDGYLPELPEE